MITKEDNYTRKLTQEEVNQIDFSLIGTRDKNAHMSEEEYYLLYNDIIKNGVKEPIVIFEDEIIDGTKRFYVILAAGLDPQNAPYAEYIGPKEELEQWLNRKNHLRRNETKDDKVVRAIKIVRPQLKEEYDARPKGRGHKVHESEKGDLCARAAQIVGVGVGLVRKGHKINEQMPWLFEYIEWQKLSVENASNIFAYATKKGFSDEWIHRMVNFLIKSDRDKEAGVRKTFKMALKQLEDEIKENKEKELAKQKREAGQEDPEQEEQVTAKVKPIPIRNTPLADYDIEAEMVVKVNRKPNETEKNFNKRIELMIPKLKQYGLFFGHSKIQLITGDVGKTLFDKALKDIMVETEKCREEIKTILVKETDKPSDVKDVGNYKVISLNQAFKKNILE